ncbi:hypothetical protein ACCT15_35670 [Rhizobium ruizarguesonis]
MAERARVTNVMERLGVAIARGEVGFALRAEKGGDFKPQKEAVDPRASALIGFGRANWNIDDFTPLFKFAQMNDGKYRVEQVPPLDWIYLERQTFDRFIGGLARELPDFNRHEEGPLARRILIEAFETGQMSRAQEKFMDEAAQEGFLFWVSSAAWPRDTPDYVFFGRVINQFGQKLFPDEWRDSELSELFMPQFERGKVRPVKPGSYEDIYLNSVVEAVETDHGVKLEPLEAFFKYIAEDRLKSRERIAKTVEMLIEAVIHGDLKTFGQRIGGGTAFVEIPGIEWTRDEVTDWFMFCHQGPYAHSPARLKRTLLASALPNFLFVHRSSLQKYMQVWGEHGDWFQYLVRYPDDALVEPEVTSSATEGFDAGADSDNEPADAEGEMRRKSKRTRVRPFIERIFPDGIPDEISDTQVYRLIAKAMDEAARRDPLLEGAPSRETILRAAGRK